MATHPLRFNAVELLRHPGSERQLSAELSPEELEVPDRRVTGAIVVALSAVSGVDGISVHGTVSTPWADQCRRCLADVSGVAVSEVDEQFQSEPGRDANRTDANQIVGDQVDLAPIVREYVVLDMPVGPLCREECAGICPQCGVDRNVSACECATAASDPRWSALEGLRLDPE